MVLVVIDHSDSEIKKSSYEVLSYGAALAEKLNTSAEALILGTVKEDLPVLGNYGISKVHHVANEKLNQVDAQLYSKVIAEAATSLKVDVLIFSHNQTGREIAPFLAAVLKAGLVSGAVALPDTSNGFVVKKNVFSGKAFANVDIKSPVKIISLNPNSFQIRKTEGVAEVNSLNISVGDPKVKVTSVNKVKGEVPLTEAEIVVSGGRGLKGP